MNKGYIQLKDAVNRAKRLGLTPRDVALKIGISHSTMYRWLAGNIKKTDKIGKYVDRIWGVIDGHIEEVINDD